MRSTAPGRLRGIPSLTCYVHVPKPFGVTMRYTLRRVYLNTGGYEYGRNGRYFGVGAPLYAYDADDGSKGGYVRAYDRKDAKETVADRHAGATFYR